MKNVHVVNQHIYITSDEDIKEEDWKYCSESNTILQANLNKENKSLTSCCKYCEKIILTTDQDLIKDGVQKIDDEFLEWFVKNPSYELVEVEREKSIGYAGDRQRTFYGGYKIIIPKEEPKQKTMSKQTVVEWLENELKKIPFINPKEAFEQAKAMEKEQKEHAYFSGSADNFNDEGDFKKYYNETYKGGEQ